MSPLVELYDPENLSRVFDAGATLIGINNRDLRTFETDLEHTLRLRSRVPDQCVLVSESGIRDRDDVARLESGRRRRDPGRRDVDGQPRHRKRGRRPARQVAAASCRMCQVSHAGALPAEPSRPHRLTSVPCPLSNPGLRGILLGIDRAAGPFFSKLPEGELSWASSTAKRD